MSSLRVSGLLLLIANVANAQATRAPAAAPAPTLPESTFAGLSYLRRDAQTVIEMVEKQIESTASRINPLLQALGLPPLVSPPKKPVTM